MKILRDYQEAAIKSLFDYLFNKEGNPLIVMPVGSGKSLFNAEFIKRVHDKWPRTRIVCLTHVKELLEQNLNELKEQYLWSDTGFYCASLNQKRLHNDITFASIQSVWNKANDFNRAPEIILCDECHLISHNDNTQYRKFFESVKSLNPNVKIIGLTGTPYRSDTGRLDDGDGKLFDDVAYEIEIGWMIDQGYLCKPFTPDVKTKMDVSGVAVRGGDYVAKQLQDAVDIDETTKSCVKEIIEHGKDRNKWLIFTAGIEHCEHVRDEVRSYGISCEMVTGKTPTDERDDIISRYKAGKIKCLVNVAVLTTGFNAPGIDLLAYMRPMKSPVLYTQTIGRGIRTVYADGFDLSTRDGRLSAIENSNKRNCMVLDFGGVIDELGPIDAIEIKKVNKFKDPDMPKGDAIMKICPACGENCAAAQRYCYSCGYAFISDSLNKNASDKAILTMDEEPETYEVLSMGLSKHYKRDMSCSIPSLKVSYATMSGSFSQWVCFDHHLYGEGSPKYYAYKAALAWHSKTNLSDKPAPSSVDEAINYGYGTPLNVTVKKEGKYYKVLDFEYGEKVKIDKLERIVSDDPFDMESYETFLGDDIPF